MDDARMTFRLPRETKTELEQLAATDRRSTGYLTRVAVEEYLARRRKSDRRRVAAGGRGA
jgi:predicted transcriptional regulator